MKILITTDRYLPPVNGVVTSVLLPVHGPRWHEVRILTLSEAPIWRKSLLEMCGVFIPVPVSVLFIPAKVIRRLICRSKRGRVYDDPIYKNCCLWILYGDGRQRARGIRRNGGVFGRRI